MMKVDILDLLNDLKAQGVMAVLENGKLQINKPNQVTLESALIDRIQENKSAIIDFLGSSEEITQIADMAVIDRSMARIPLSYAQERIWQTGQLEGSSSYHIPAICKISGALNVSALKKAFECVINRHEVLRTIYPDHKGSPYQEILPQKAWTFDVLDFSRASYAEIKDFLTRETNRPFKLTQKAPIRAILVKAKDNAHYFSMAIHRIAADGPSIPVLQNELIQHYYSCNEGKTAELPQLELQYVDYACWQRKQWDCKAINNQLDYWTSKLSGYEPLNFNADFSPETDRSSRRSVVNHMISRELSAKVNQQCTDHNVSPYMYLLAAYKVLLSQYTGQKDVIVGSPFANRPHQNIESLIGFFVNTVPLRTVIDSSNSFADLLSEIRETVLAAFQNQDAPIEKIIEKVGGTQDINQSTLIQSQFILQDKPETSLQEVSDIKMEWETTCIEDAMAALTFMVVPNPAGITIQANSCDKLFKEETLINLVDHFENILNAVVKDPSLVIADLPKMSIEEMEEAMAL
ncbi:MAG: condensation domain-containing protein [Cytophagales bacterium]|nr:condensation domain-containing protein [Cytophagales bacterium]